MRERGEGRERGREREGKGERGGREGERGEGRERGGRERRREREGGGRERERGLELDEEVCELTEAYPVWGPGLVPSSTASNCTTSKSLASLSSSETSRITPYTHTHTHTHTHTEVEVKTIGWN